jgi:hypothetical protein
MVHLEARFKSRHDHAEVDCSSSREESNVHVRGHGRRIRGVNTASQAIATLILRRSSPRST